MQQKVCLNHYGSYFSILGLIYALSPSLEPQTSSLCRCFSPAPYNSRRRCRNSLIFRERKHSSRRRRILSCGSGAACILCITQQIRHLAGMEKERFPGMGDGSRCLGRNIYDAGFGRFKSSNGDRKQEESPPRGQARSEPKPRHTRDFRHKYQKPAAPWNMKDPSRMHMKYTFGIKMSPISRHLQGYPPKHSMHPSLKNEPPPSFHRRSSEITEIMENPMRLWKPCVDPTLYYGRRKTDATAQFRVIPKANDPNESSPWHGRLATWITDYSCLDEELDRVEKQRALPKVPQTQLFY